MTATRHDSYQEYFLNSFAKNMFLQLPCQEEIYEEEVRREENNQELSPLSIFS